MKPSQLATLLAQAIAAGEPVLITGAPGIGKSDIVAQAAALAHAHLLLSHPAVEDPTNVGGLPWVAKGSKTATFLPFGNMAKAMQATERTVWFLDDLGQAPAAVQASYMQLLLAGEVNGHKLPGCVTFVAATNRRTDRAGVTGILEPVKSRFSTIVELVTDLDEWCTWALAHNMPIALVAFLRFRPDLLCDFTPSADMVNCPLPRTWANAGRWMNLSPANDPTPAVIQGAVGEGAGTELLAFLSMYRQLPNIDALLLDPAGATIPTDPAVLYAITTALATKATEQNFDRITAFADRLLGEQRGEFATLLIRDAIHRDPSLQQTDAFVRMTPTDLGQLISGAVQ